MSQIRQQEMKSRSKLRGMKRQITKGKKNRKSSRKDSLPTWEGMIKHNDIKDLSFLNLPKEEFYANLGTKYSGVHRLLYENQDHKWRREWR